MELLFEWDEDKARANLRKHHVSFEEGRTIFGDPYQMTYPDPGHSDYEERHISIGASARGRILVVSHTEREMRIRLISCRRATLVERREYEKTSFGAAGRH
jgi:uncharacterized DUF497 family protein